MIIFLGRFYPFSFYLCFCRKRLVRLHPCIRFCDCLYSCISVFVIVCICICQEGKKLCAAAIFASFEGKLRRKLSRLNSPCLHIRHTSSPSHWLNSPWSLCLYIHHTSSPSSHITKVMTMIMIMNQIYINSEKYLGPLFLLIYLRTS